MNEISNKMLEHLSTLLDNNNLSIDELEKLSNVFKAIINEEQSNYLHSLLIELVAQKNQNTIKT